MGGKQGEVRVLCGWWCSTYMALAGMSLVVTISVFTTSFNMFPNFITNVATRKIGTKLLTKTQE